MHYRNLLAAVKTAPHPDDISPTGVHVRYSIYYIHNATINSNCRSCVCRSQSQCRKEFKKLTSCSRDVAHTLLTHTHTAHTHPVHTYNSHTPSVVLYTQSSPDASSAYFSDLLHYQTILVPVSGGGGVMAKPQHCDTKHLNASQLRQQARFLFELFYEFYWQRHLNVSKRHLRCCRDRC